MSDHASHPFVALMRRYCVDYTARHDVSVCADIMEPGYTLHMGGYHLVGRDAAYIPAATIQFRQFPGLGLTVNDVICNGDRLALHFSEHGASVRHSGALAAWSGIGLYRWNGTRLTENYVEQDYFARRRQLTSGRPDLVEAPAVAPWDIPIDDADPTAEETVRGWLRSSHFDDLNALSVDDSRTGRPVRRLLEIEAIEVEDIFSAGSRVAFHCVQHGRLTDQGASELDGAAAAPASLHVVGIVAAAAGEIVSGRVIRDRLGLAKRLAAG